MINGGLKLKGYVKLTLTIVEEIPLHYDIIVVCNMELYSYTGLRKETLNYVFITLLLAVLF